MRRQRGIDMYHGQPFKSEGNADERSAIYCTSVYAATYSACAAVPETSR